jgi:hypothetical protein
MNYDNTNHNKYPNGCTLTNCKYVNVKEGCTGNISGCNYVEIGENNTGLSLSNVNYCSIGDNNKTVTISNSSYIIVGSDSENIMIGEHDRENSRFEGRTGANSLVVGHNTIGAEITGRNSRYDRSRNIQADGTFNQVVSSGVVFLDDANGNELNNSSRVDLQNTNNNSVETININLKDKAPFLDYALVNDVTRVASRAPVVNRQSDASGTILDRGLNTLINKQDGKDNPKYTLQNGMWVRVE